MSQRIRDNNDEHSSGLAPEAAPADGTPGIRHDGTATSPAGIGDLDTASDAVSAYAQLGLIVVKDQPLRAVLSRIAALAATTVPGADDVSVTLIERGGARSIAFSGHLAMTLDERQYSDGFGPGLDAAATGQIISIEDTAHEATYTGFAGLAHRHGIRHALSVGIPTYQDTAGSLNIYGTGKTGPFTVQARDTATIFAGYAAVALLNAESDAGAPEENAQMHQAMASRVSIEHAKSIIMRDRSCTAEEAFVVLCDAASHSNRKLRVVAQTIIDEATHQ